MGKRQLVPYKDIQKKTLYQRNYMREYMRTKRTLLKQSKLNDTLLRPNVKTQLDADGNILYDF